MICNYQLSSSTSDPKSSAASTHLTKQPNYASAVAAAAAPAAVNTATARDKQNHSPAMPTAATEEDNHDK